MEQPKVIVVGVDGSPAGDAALRFAVDEAQRTGDAVEVLTAWQVDPSLASPYAVISDFPSLSELQQAAQQRQDEAVARVLGTPPALEVAGRTPRGDAATLLVQSGRHARLIVVGSRAIGPIRAALLGSVSRYVAHHAPCPVVVVPEPAEAASERPEVLASPAGA